MYSSQTVFLPDCYCDVIDNPRYEDFEITYLHNNPWAHLGMGYANLDANKGGDLRPYLQLENIDPRWLNAIGYEKPAEEVQAVREDKEKVGTSGEERFLME